MSTTQQPEALALAQEYRVTMPESVLHLWAADAMDTMRRQHARILELEAQLSVIGAGGVEPLRKPAAAPQAQADARDAQMWAPIDTAPKDGSWIQLWREPEKKIGDCAPLVFGRWHDEYESWVWPDHAHYDPFTERGIERANSDIEAGNAFSTDAFTHWRPLGKPAIADQAKQGGM